MESIFYVMAILGCGDTGTSCDQARIAAPTYRTVAACRADAGNVLTANTDLDYPTLRADCRKGVRPAAYVKPKAITNRRR